MWFKEISTDSDVVISSRIRYARNIQGFKFPNAISNEDIEKMENLIHAAVSNKYKIFKLKDIDEITQRSLVEQHIISKEFLYNEEGMFVCSEDYKLVMMVNEEDHLRIQSFESGLNIKKCYDSIVNFTKEIQNKISFSKTDDYGYLTSCPTNVGSGMRVSVMLHLPALYKRGLLNKLFDQAATIGVSIRGLYGENTTANGNIYQISNKKTLGMSDEDIISVIQGVVTLIIEQERSARNLLFNSDVSIIDEIFRAYGILKYSRAICAVEALDLLSKVRLGVSIGVIKEVELKKIQSLISDIEPCSLKLLLKEDILDIEEDIKRAEYIRGELD